MPRELIVGADRLLHKGTAVEFDEAAHPPRSPAYLETNESDAFHYARILKADDDAPRRVVTYRPAKALRFLLLDEDHAETLAETEIAPGSASEMARSAAGIGYDGLAVDAGEAGHHLVLVDVSSLLYVATQPLEPDAPAP